MIYFVGESIYLVAYIIHTGNLLGRESGYIECCGDGTYDVRTETCCYDSYSIPAFVHVTSEKRRQHCCSPTQEGQGQWKYDAGWHILSSNI